MKVPRDVSGAELAKALRVLGYQQTRQEGSHIRLTTQVMGISVGQRGLRAAALPLSAGRDGLALPLPTADL